MKRYLVSCNLAEARPRWAVAVVVEILAGVLFAGGTLVAYFVLHEWFHESGWIAVAVAALLGLQAGVPVFALGHIMEALHDVRLHTAAYEEVEENGDDDKA